MKRIGVLCGGGDSSAINAGIRAILRRCEDHGWSVVGIGHGWRGLITPEIVPLTLDAVEGSVNTGGTILGTSRTNPFRIEGGPQKVMDNVRVAGLDALIIFGGDDTLTVAHRLAEYGLRAVGLPQTVDNDINGTDYSIGFDTAVNNDVDAIQRMVSSNIAHEAWMLVEVMGREAGWIAVATALATAADAVLVPEEPADLEALCAMIKRKEQQGRKHGLIIVSEGVTIGGLPAGLELKQVDAFGHAKLGGVAYHLADLIEQQIGVRPRVNVLGYIQRGGPPTVFDAILSVRLSTAAVDLVAEGRFNVMVGLVGNKVSTVPLVEAIGANRKVDMEMYRLAKGLGALGVR
ncbi:MAG: ATP-dependent 6-phosphofructokinase [Chloroflexi bacterium]|nr:ATP-dependent 6-phosphofructokinase [Chloroflexota bacterium]MCL5074251.1 ATP-dependent 6-phosphofructokinase [Chloroflexota bacterium]